MSKIFDKKDVYSSITLTKDVINLIGTYGYFSNKMIEEVNERSEKHQLSHLIIDTNGMYFVTNDQSEYTYFLPENKVKDTEESKKWRPFTLEEFNKVIPMGTVFKYRYKTSNEKDVYSIYYHANLDCENGFQAIYIENRYYSFDYCFNELRLFLNGRWQPFGVEE